MTRSWRACPTCGRSREPSPRIPTAPTTSFRIPSSRRWPTWTNSSQGPNLVAWLFTILRNHFYTELRNRRREVEDADGAHAARIGERAAADRQPGDGRFSEGPGRIAGRTARGAGSRRRQPGFPMKTRPKSAGARWEPSRAGSTGHGPDSIRFWTPRPRRTRRTTRDADQPCPKANEDRRRLRLTGLFQWRALPLAQGQGCSSPGVRDAAGRRSRLSAGAVQLQSALRARRGIHASGGGPVDAGRGKRHHRRPARAPHAGGASGNHQRSTRNVATRP